jgi:hypothetical protein
MSDHLQQKDDDLPYYVVKQTPPPLLWFENHSSFDLAIKSAILSASKDPSACLFNIGYCPLDEKSYTVSFKDLLILATVDSNTPSQRGGDTVLVTCFDANSFAQESPLEFFQRLCVEIGFYISHANKRSDRVIVSLTKQPDPGYLFYVNMLKRKDGSVVNDLGKTDGKIYFTPEEAQEAIDADLELSSSRCVVEMVAKMSYTRGLKYNAARKG